MNDLEREAFQVVEALADDMSPTYASNRLLGLIRAVVRDELTRAGITPAEEEVPDPDVNRCTAVDGFGNRCTMGYVHIHSNSNRPHRFGPSHGAEPSHGTDIAAARTDVPTMATVDRLPTTAADLAHLMLELDDTAVPGQPDPSIALWDRLAEQEGYDVAAPLWRDACNYVDHLMSDDG